MQTITTTQLRTKSKNLISALKEGKNVELIHRSRIVGEIIPKTNKVKIFDLNKIYVLSRKLSLTKFTDIQKNKQYQKEMDKKHVKNIS